MKDATDIETEKLLADTLMSEGYGGLSTENLDEALHYFEQALPIYQKIGFQEGIIRALNGIALCFEEEFEKAQGYYVRALEIA